MTTNARRYSSADTPYVHSSAGAHVELLSGLMQLSKHAEIAGPKLKEKPPRRARVITLDDLENVLKHRLPTSGSPESDELKLLLSFYAGLRAGKIASLTLANVADARGEIGDTIWIASSQAKRGRERTIPMHPRIRESMMRFRRRHPDLDYFACSSRWPGSPIRRQSAKLVAAWFKRVYEKAGLQGCSSHSGRRSFITQLARCANDALCSLHDVQRLVGHARLDTTQAYIEPSSTVKTLVYSLGSDVTGRRIIINSTSTN